MMGINANTLNDKYDFEVTGVSYAGAPKDGTVMYVSKKVEKLIHNLAGKKNCLIFCEDTIEVPASLSADNLFVPVKNPQGAYASFVDEFAKQKYAQEAAKKYVLQPEGYYLGEGAVVGQDCYIEPGCLIGHGVVIGNQARILAGSVIKNAIIGDRFVCNERAVIGAVGFTMADDEDGNKVRIPTLGRVVIGDDVEIGTQDNISCGSGGDSVIGNHVKIDSLVYIGHDAHIEKNVEITGGVVIGGYVTIGEETRIGLNSTIRNRITIGKNVVIGMGSVVTKSVPDGMTKVGNPARVFES